MILDAIRLNNGLSAVSSRNAADSYLRMSEDAKKMQLKDEQTVKGSESRFNPDGTLKDERFTIGSAEKTEKSDITDKADDDENKLGAEVHDKDDDKITDKKDKDGFLKDPPDCECETCRKRRYKDASEDSAVSFQGPTRMSPQAAKSRVRSHELEHVRRESIKAKTQGKRVLSQTVRIRTATCSECGRVYVSGGTTKTVTRPDMRDFHRMFMLGFDEEDVVNKDVI